ncbi:MAG TPA: hypothetical protein VHG51_06420 [Longimicrobiaceae bacterium]|nr:hypothetical protein [Longimicrobiaceae bacterium]
MDGDEITRGVLVRDLVLFQIKLALDSLKDIALMQASLVAAVVELLFMPVTRGRIFYGVLRFSERVDLWLNLYGAAEGAERDLDGLFGTSRAGDPTFLGKLEQVVRQKEREFSRHGFRGARRAA